MREEGKFEVHVVFRGLYKFYTQTYTSLKTPKHFNEFVNLQKRKFET